jgi:hypothetical protein
VGSDVESFWHEPLRLIRSSISSTSLLLVLTQRRRRRS